MLRWVRRGVPCYWTNGPPRTAWNQGRSCDRLSQEEAEWMEREERRLVDIGAWKRVRHNRFVSKCFLVPKAGLDAQGRKKHRLIMDLRPLNIQCRAGRSRVV